MEDDGTGQARNRTALHPSPLVRKNGPLNRSAEQYAGAVSHLELGSLPYKHLNFSRGTARLKMADTAVRSLPPTPSWHDIPSDLDEARKLGPLLMLALHQLLNGQGVNDRIIAAVDRPGQFDGRHARSIITVARTQLESVAQAVAQAWKLEESIDSVPQQTTVAVHTWNAAKCRLAVHFADSNSFYEP